MTSRKTVIDEDTRFVGDLAGEEVIVAGSVKGGIKASRHVFIKKSAVVEGSISTPKVFFQEGARHTGALILDDLSIPETSSSSEPTLDNVQSEKSDPEDPAKTKVLESQTSKSPKGSATSDRLW